MTITLSGRIQCSGGVIVHVGQDVIVPSGWTFGFDHRIDFPNGLEIRAGKTTWHVKSPFQIDGATVEISVTNSNQKPAEKLKALFVANGFSVSEVENAQP